MTCISKQSYIEASFSYFTCWNNCSVKHQIPVNFHNGENYTHYVLSKKRASLLSTIGKIVSYFTIIAPIIFGCIALSHIHKDSLYVYGKKDIKWFGLSDIEKVEKILKTIGKFNVLKVLYEEAPVLCSGHKIKIDSQLNWRAQANNLGVKIHPSNSKEESIECAIFELINLTRKHLAPKCSEFNSAKEYARALETWEYGSIERYIFLMQEVRKEQPGFSSRFLQGFQEFVRAGLEKHLKDMKKSGHTDFYERQFHRYATSSL
ncbi:MAG: hypothetical protein MRY21_03270 [Simkaniaceae bacterium]|nr:hypothetical protein [Simkaniaceae bacterium]